MSHKSNQTPLINIKQLELLLYYNIKILQPIDLRTILGFYDDLMTIKRELTSHERAKCLAPVIK